MIGGIFDKWYLYFFYFIFFFGSIYINKEQRIYTISINNSNGPKEFILDKFSREIKSRNIDFTDERFYKYIKNELNERQFYSNTNMSLLEDLINEKRKNTNVKTKTEKFIDIYSVRKNLVSTKNVLDLIETNKKKFQKFDYQIENIEERSIDIVVKVNSNRTFEVYDLILFIKRIIRI